jgi:hypothetical protein
MVLLVGLHHALQFKQSLKPSTLEVNQRKKFLKGFKGLITTYKPQIFVDESPDTSNPDLLALCPGRICVDIPHEEKMRQNLYIRRNEATLCPFVDTKREEYWRNKIEGIIAGHSSARVLLMCGINHLYRFTAKPMSFPDMLLASV